MPNRIVNDKDIENINYVYYKMKQHRPECMIRFSELAEATGWSVTTVKKYLNKNWVPNSKDKEYCDTNLEHPGLYLLGDTKVIENIIKYYLKTGQAKNIANRLKQYKTTNPTVKLLDTCFIPEERLDKKEKEYQEDMKWFGTKVGKTEWFEVSKEVYEKLAEVGFKEPFWRLIPTEIAYGK